MGVVRTQVQQLHSLGRRALIALSIGFAVSVYALYIEVRFAANPNYAAACDISSVISCTAVLSSPYARGLGLIGPWLGDAHPLNQPNALYGLIGYSLLAAIQSTVTKPVLVVNLVAAALLNVMNVYLFSVLIGMRTVCLVCYSIYAVNIAFAVCAWQRWRLFNAIRHKKTQ